MRAAFYVLLVGIFLISSQSLAYTGTFYADFGLQSRDQACRRIIGAFKRYGPLQPYPADCLFVDPGKYYGLYHTKDAITLQFRHIDGSIYEMVYDIPNAVAIAMGNPLPSNFSLRTALASVGVTADRSNPAVAAALERADAARRAEYDRIGPPCRDITVTGLAAALSIYFAQIGSNSDINDLLARNPLNCSEETYGQSIFNGNGLYNPTYIPTYIRRCRGLVLLDEHSAKIIAWDKDFYTISTELEFDTGLQQVTLYVKREDAACSR